MTGATGKQATKVVNAAWKAIAAAGGMIVVVVFFSVIGMLFVKLVNLLTGRCH